MTRNKYRCSDCGRLARVQAVRCLTYPMPTWRVCVTCWRSYGRSWFPYHPSNAEVPVHV